MLRAFVVLFLLLAPAASLAQGMNPQIGAPVPIVVNQAPAAPAVAGGGVINIGQAFGTVMQPYIDALVQAAIVGAMGWIGWLLKNKLGVDTDAKQRDALQAFLLNTANSLIAAGAVQMQGKTVTVRSEALAAEVNTAITRIPDALKHFGLDAPSAAGLLKDKILDAIPQTTAGAEIITQAHAANGGAADPVALTAASGSSVEAAPKPAAAEPIPVPAAPAPGVTSAAEKQAAPAAEPGGAQSA